MSEKASDDVVVEHEVGHASAFLYLGFGVARVTIKPDHDEYSGSTTPRVSVDDMPRYHRVVAKLAGYRANQAVLTDDLNTTTDLQDARRWAREMTGAQSDGSAEVAQLIDKAWADASEILERMAPFRERAVERLQEHRPFSSKKVIEVEDLRERGVGYEIAFGEPRGKMMSAVLTVDGGDAGYVNFAEEAGTDGITRRVLVQAYCPAEFRHLGHAQRLVIAIRDRPGEAALVDSPQTNTDEGEQLLGTLRRRGIAIHDHACYRGAEMCVCSLETR